jgi:hypothetical protein
MFLKKETEATTVNLSICLSFQVTFEVISRFYEIEEGGHAVEGGIDAEHFNPLASTIPKWWTFKLLRWMQNLQESMWGL